MVHFTKSTFLRVNLQSSLDFHGFDIRGFEYLRFMIGPNLLYLALYWAYISSPTQHEMTLNNYKQPKFSITLILVTLIEF